MASKQLQLFADQRAEKVRSKETLQDSILAIYEEDTEWSSLNEAMKGTREKMKEAEARIEANDPSLKKLQIELKDLAKEVKAVTESLTLAAVTDLTKGKKVEIEREGEKHTAELSVKWKKAT